MSVYCSTIPMRYGNIAALGLLMALIALPVTGEPETGRTKKSVKYETDGHYWTVLLVATMLEVPDAREIAYYAEYPDNVMNRFGYQLKSRPTFIYPRAQKKVHALTGGHPNYERTQSINMMLEARTTLEKGYALHRLADSYAHTNDKKGRMYPHIIGHTLLWKKPDKITTNPAKYLDYVRALVECLGGNPETFDMRAFQYIADAGLKSSVNSSILKAEYHLHLKSAAFNIPPRHLAEVQRYLDRRKESSSPVYTVYVETDEGGNDHTTIILRSAFDLTFTETPVITNTQSLANRF